MEIPRYIFISDTRADTEKAFLSIFENKSRTKLLIMSSSSPNTEIAWLFSFLDSLKVGMVHLKVDKDDTKAVKTATAAIEKNGNDICLGIGGGRILDVAKYASFSSGIPFISFPSMLSHDGIASPVAVIHDGKHWSESRIAASPFAVVVDLETVIGAPAYSMLSGISDLTANLFAAMDAERFADSHDKEYEPLATAIARSASQLVFPGFRNVSVDSLSKGQTKHLAWGLVLSGIAMSISGNSRPASGAEHKISHAIDYLFPSSGSHGFTVSVGNVVSSFLHEQYQKEIISFNLALGLPVVGEDIGIKKREFAKVIDHAGTIRPDRYTILEDKKLAQGDILALLDDIENTAASIRNENR